MKKSLFILILIIVTASQIYAQESYFKTSMDSISWYADIMNYASKYKHRKYAEEQLSELLWEVCKNDPIFNMLHTDIPGLEYVYSSDSTLRFITWQLLDSKGRGQFNGIFQLKGEKPLNLSDKSQLVGSPQTGSFPPDRWIGVVYTDIIRYGDKSDSTYVLIGSGIVNNSRWKHIAESIKIENGKLIFGADAFVKDGKSRDRITLEFSAASGVSMQYMQKKSLLIYDKLSAIIDPRTGERSMVPDGTYEGYDKKEEHWEYVEYATPVSTDKRKNPEKVDIERKKEKGLFKSKPE